MVAAEGPLKGITVVDLTQVEFGPCATQVLGDYGADIIKIERPVVGDLSRSTDPFISEVDGESAYFMSLNRNKRSVVLDLRDPEGLAALRMILKRADVFVHNFRPGVPERLGIGYEALKAEHPGLIYASGSGFGTAGPLAGKPGQDILAQALSGAVFRNPDVNGLPQIYPTACVDFSAGMILAQGVLLALYARERTGQGDKISVSLLDTMLAMQMQELTQWMLRGEQVNWVEQNLVGTFRTSDGSIAVVGVFRPNPLADICVALEMDLAQDPDFSTPQAAIRNKARLWPLLAARVEQLSTADVLERLDAADVLCAEILDEERALEQPQVKENGILTSFEHPVHGNVRTVGNPLMSSAVSRDQVRPSPVLGEHTTEVLLESGIDQEKVDTLYESGVCT